MNRSQSRASRLRAQTREEALIELKRVLLSERAARLRQAAMQPAVLALPPADATESAGD